MSYTNKIHLTWYSVATAVERIADEIKESGFKPDYIVGLTRGGLTPAVMLSNLIDVPMYAVHIQLRDGWVMDNSLLHDHVEKGTNILVIDDICDTAKTFEEMCEQYNTDRTHVKFAALVNKKDNHGFDVDYTADLCKDSAKSWIVFPWEDIAYG